MVYECVYRDKRCAPRRKQIVNLWLRRSHPNEKKNKLENGRIAARDDLLVYFHIRKRFPLAQVGGECVVHRQLV